MITYSIYDPASGVFIGRLGQTENDPVPPNSVEGEYPPSEFMWDGTQAVPVTQWTPVVEPNRVSGLPPATHVRWGGASTDTTTVDDGVIEFDLVAGQSLGVTLHPTGHGVMCVEVKP